MAKKEEAAKLLAEDIRMSIDKAKKLINGAGKVHVRDTCINVPLATSFLEHPPAAVDTLLTA